MTIAGNSLYSEFKSVFKDFLDGYVRSIDILRINHERVPKLSIGENGIASVIEYYKPDILITINTLARKYIKTEKYKEFKRIIESEPQIGPRINHLIGTDLWRRRFTTEDLFKSVIVRYFRQNEFKLLLNDMLLRKTWNYVVDSILAKEVAVNIFAVVENLETDIKIFKIGPNYFLKKLSYNDIERLWNTNALFREYYPFSGMNMLMSPINISSIIEAKIILPVDFGEPAYVSNGTLRSSLHDTQRIFLDFIDTLKLYKKEYVGLGPVIISVNVPWGGSQGQGNRQNNPLLPFQDKYILAKKDQFRLRKLFKTFSSIPKTEVNKSLSIGIRRIRMANDRQLDEDKFIDLIIALEAMLLTKDENSELSYRLGQRAAFLLGKNFDEREYYFKIVKKAYKTRSQIVHGSILGGSDKQMIDDISDIARNIAYKLLLLQSQDKCPDWERLIFDK